MRRLLVVVLVLSAVIAFVAVVTSRAWLFQPIRNSQGSSESFGFTAMALDSSGHLHVVYTSSLQGLLLSTYEGGGWSSSTITASTAYAPAVAVDSRGTHHVAFLVLDAWNSSHPGQNLLYATDAGGTWTVSYIDYGVGPPSIAVDAQDRVHVAYAKFAGCSLRYATLTGDVWNGTTVSSFYCYDSWGMGVSLSIDPSGEPRVAYADHFTVGYAALVDGAWIAEPVLSDFSLFVMTVPSIVLDNQGRPHIGVMAHGDLLHLYQTGGTWVNESVDQVGTQLPFYAELGADPSGGVHILYNDPSRGVVKYAVNRGGTWSVSTLDSGIIAQAVSAVVGPGDRVQLVYARYLPNSAQAVLMYATNAVDLSDGWKFLLVGLPWVGLAIAVVTVVFMLAVVPLWNSIRVKRSAGPRS